MDNLHRLLSLLLKSAVKAKLISVSPISDVQTKPRPKRQEIVALDESELAALLAHLKDGPLYLPALLAACPAYGMARSAGLGGGSDFAKGTLQVSQQVQNIRGELVTLTPKTDRSRRTVRVPETVMAALKEHRAEQSALRLKLGLPARTRLGLWLLTRSAVS